MVYFIVICLIASTVLTVSTIDFQTTKAKDHTNSPATSNWDLFYRNGTFMGGMHYTFNSDNFGVYEAPKDGYGTLFCIACSYIEQSSVPSVTEWLTERFTDPQLDFFKSCFQIKLGRQYIHKFANITSYNSMDSHQKLQIKRIPIYSVNKEYPQFEPTNTIVHVKENNPDPLPIIIDAYDLDEQDTSASRLTFNYTPQDDIQIEMTQEPHGKRRIDNRLINIYRATFKIIAPLDYEKRPLHIIRFSVQDAGDERLDDELFQSHIINGYITIKVGDQPDQPPRFEKSSYYSEIKITDAANIYLNDTVSAYDGDTGINRTIVLKILRQDIYDGLPAKDFDLPDTLVKQLLENAKVLNSSILSLTKDDFGSKTKLHFKNNEEYCSYYSHDDVFALFSSNNGEIQIGILAEKFPIEPNHYYNSLAIYTIRMLFKAEPVEFFGGGPQELNNPLETSVRSEPAEGTVLNINVNVKSCGYGIYGEISLEINSTDIIISPAKGRERLTTHIQVSRTSEFNCMKRNEKRYTIIAKNTIDSSMTATKELIVKILPINNHAPEISGMNSLKLNEVQCVNRIIYNFTFKDEDCGEFGKVNVTINDDTFRLEFDEISGRIYLEKPLNWLKKNSYFIEILAKDGGNRKSIKTVEVEVLNNHVNPPEFITGTSFPFKEFCHTIKDDYEKHGAYFGLMNGNPPNWVRKPEIVVNDPDRNNSWPEFMQLKFTDDNSGKYFKFDSNYQIETITDFTKLNSLKEVYPFPPCDFVENKIGSYVIRLPIEGTEMNIETISDSCNTYDNQPIHIILYIEIQEENFPPKFNEFDPFIPQRLICSVSAPLTDKNISIGKLQASDPNMVGTYFKETVFAIDYSNSILVNFDNENLIRNFKIDENDTLRLELKKNDLQFQPNVQSGTINLKVEVIDGGFPPLTDKMDISLEIEAGNYRSPYFVEDEWKDIIQIKEDIKKNEKIGEIKAKDDDFGHKLTYQIRINETRNELDELVTLPRNEFYFDINENGEIITRRCFDVIKVKEFDLIIQVEDIGTDNYRPCKEQRIERKLSVKITPINRYQAIFSEQFGEGTEQTIDDNCQTVGTLKYSTNSSFSEGAHVNEVLLHINAKFPNKLTVVHYCGNSEEINVDETLGTLLLGKEVFYENKSLSIDIHASHEKCTMDRRSDEDSVLSINFQILLLNNFSPLFSSPEESASLAQRTFTISEDHNNDVISDIQIVATDRDKACNGQVRYFIKDKEENFPFELNEITGELKKVKELDYRIQSTYVLIIEAKDNFCREYLEGKMSSITIYIRLTPENRHVPQFTQLTYKANSIEDIFPVGGYLSYQNGSQILAIDSDPGDFGKVQYSIVKQVLIENDEEKEISSFEINENSGQVPKDDNGNGNENRAEILLSVKEPEALAPNWDVTVTEYYVKEKDDNCIINLIAKYQENDINNFGIDDRDPVIKSTFVMDENENCVKFRNPETTVKSCRTPFYQLTIFAVYVIPFPDLSATDYCLQDGNRKCTSKSFSVYVSSSNGNYAVIDCIAQEQKHEMLEEKVGEKINFKLKDNEFYPLQLTNIRQLNYLEEFEVNEEFEVISRMALDREEKDVYKLFVEFIALSDENLEQYLNESLNEPETGNVAILSITIELEDINDNRPMFDYREKNIDVTINVESQYNVEVLKLLSHDRDLNENSNHYYWIDEETFETDAEEYINLIHRKSIFIGENGLNQKQNSFNRKDGAVIIRPTEYIHRANCKFSFMLMMKDNGTKCFHPDNLQNDTGCDNWIKITIFALSRSGAVKILMGHPVNFFTENTEQIQNLLRNSFTDATLYLSDAKSEMLGGTLQRHGVKSSDKTKRIGDESTNNSSSISSFLLHVIEYERILRPEEILDRIDYSQNYWRLINELNVMHIEAAVPTETNKTINRETIVIISLSIAIVLVILIFLTILVVERGKNKRKLMSLKALEQTITQINTSKHTVIPGTEEYENRINEVYEPQSHYSISSSSTIHDVYNNIKDNINTNKRLNEKAENLIDNSHYGIPLGESDEETEYIEMKFNRRDLDY
ncbi:hypothetical protein SNEBB_005141 [Seison nebaliae]|nr:hypothetical protein SNEBB_005141 [Seison nebaliae]